MILGSYRTPTLVKSELFGPAGPIKGLFDTLVDLTKLKNIVWKVKKNLLQHQKLASSAHILISANSRWPYG